MLSRKKDRVYNHARASAILYLDTVVICLGEHLLIRTIDTEKGTVKVSKRNDQQGVYLV